MELALLILRYAWPFVLAGVVWGWQETRLVAADVHLSAMTRRADAAEAKLADAEKRSTDLALLWSAQVNRNELDARKAKEATDAQFSTLADRVRHLPAGGTCVAPAAVDQLLRDITSAANAAGSPDLGGAATSPVPAASAAHRPND